ncbi:acetyl-CoA carboxylase biotin carboxyl carrier protein [Novosphingobium colocasiae]|uniref:Biotin carboxyl carrier protein of acetyl-CoA carboxylase n=1 Tax=Novosphingobium colocasiae TaxID=1256513 RepID=A0A918UEB7_9SPHN|nr:biotin/lipoyl-containing protein [Novosphingobium colocasiae]GGY95770.1 acetyl-CoA carboxylase biotin carboxyl carrier protein subunit [Novosphingobium colocasiae]
MSDQLARDIEILAELFKAGGWAELRVEGGGLSLLMSNDRAAAGLEGTAVVAAAPVPAAVQAPAATAPAASAATPASAKSGPIDPAWTAVLAPNLGTFYRAPKPGAAPFVEIGQRIDADAEICLIEVMKLFTSVKAGITGTVRHVAAADAQLVEGGEPLIYIEQD